MLSVFKFFPYKDRMNPPIEPLYNFEIPNIKILLSCLLVGIEKSF